MESPPRRVRRGSSLGRRATSPASEACFAALYPGLRRLAAVVADADMEPDDLVQEALVRALQKGPLDELRDPATYLRRAIVNLASNERRRLGRRRTAVRRLGPDADEQPAYPSDLADLQSLPAIDRAALYLTQVEGLSAEEAGSELGLSANAVNLRVSRSRRLLRRQLRPGSDQHRLNPTNTASGAP